MRAYASGRAGAAPSTTVGPNLYAIAARPLYLVECGVFNTTTTAAQVAIQRATSAGTSSGALTEFSEDSEVTPVGVASTGFSVGPTITAGALVNAMLGAAAGAGVIWTFGGKGLIVPAGTANGLVITCTQGTGQVVDFYFVWEE